MSEAKVFFSASVMDAVNDQKFEDVDVPEWGANMTIRIRNMTAIQRGVFVERASQMAIAKKTGEGVDDVVKKQNKEIEILLTRLCACDETGNPIFTEANDDWLGQRNGDVIGRLAAVAQRLSGMTKDAGETIVKNLEPVANGVSSSV